jgi:hypothetical protein
MLILQEMEVERRTSRFDYPAFPPLRLTDLALIGVFAVIALLQGSPIRLVRRRLLRRRLVRTEAARPAVRGVDVRRRSNARRLLPALHSVRGRY